MVFLLALAAHASPATPTESQSALYQAMTPRHLEQSCSALSTLSATPQADRPGANGSHEVAKRHAANANVAPQQPQDI